MAVQILHQGCACYLIFTLTATSLAKLRRWRSSSLSMMREQVIPIRAAVGVTIAAALLELALSTLLMLEETPLLTGLATSILFLAFGFYRLAVAARTKSLMCACAGSPQYGPATPRAVTATVVSFLFMIGVACCWTFTETHGTTALRSVGVVAWFAPFVVLFIGLFGRSRGPATGNQETLGALMGQDSIETATAAGPRTN
jgi:hypothetical protein